MDDVAPTVATAFRPVAKSVINVNQPLTSNVINISTPQSPGFMQLVQKISMMTPSEQVFMETIVSIMNLGDAKHRMIMIQDIHTYVLSVRIKSDIEQCKKLVENNKKRKAETSFEYPEITCPLSNKK